MVLVKLKNISKLTPLICVVLARLTLRRSMYLVRKEMSVHWKLSCSVPDSGVILYSQVFNSPPTSKPSLHFDIRAYHNLDHLIELPKLTVCNLGTFKIYYFINFVINAKHTVMR